MKRANGTGTVFKMGGNRRKPWAVRVSAGFDEKGRQVFEYIGYGQTKSEALDILEDYRRNPYKDKNLTFKDAVELFSNYYEKASAKSTIRGFRTNIKKAAFLYDLKLHDIRIDDVQKMVDSLDCNKSVCRKAVSAVRMVLNYFSKLEMYPQSRVLTLDLIQYTDKPDPASNPHTPFREEEIRFIWNCEGTQGADMVLVLLYTGLRIGELLNLATEDIYLDEQYFKVRESKTTAGLRDVPIADSILPIITRYFDPKKKYLFTDKSGRRISYPSFKKNHWRTVLPCLQHMPHDTRHTFITLLILADVSSSVIKSVVGHKKGNDVTDIYTHIPMKTKLEAVNQLEVPHAE